ncbi:GGDEF domain-containing protein [Mycolicibacterium komossense]|nr:GGDEF domain-containing protein [Mycolicibacterium komossense]
MIIDNRRLHQSDHYYWLTALIAARGGQTYTCRVIAALIFGIGVIPSAVVGTYSGPHAVRDRILAIAITVCCAAMASLWLRARWPSRGQSQLCVVVGTLCVAVACLIVADPAFGLLGATSFGALGAFIAFFHTGKLLAFTWTVGACVLITLAVRLAPISTPLAIASVVLVALVSVFAAFACRMVIRLLDTETVYGEIEPLTGLLNKDAFYDKVATLIGARSRDDDQYLVVAVLNLDSYSLLVDMAGGANGDRARVEVGQRLRETVRRGALVAHVGDTDFMIAELFTTPDPSALIDRALSAISTTPLRMTASIGVVTTPLRPLVSYPPHEVLDEVLGIATTAMHDARKEGGNRAKYVLRPDLRIFDETDDFDDGFGEAGNSGWPTND